MRKATSKRVARLIRRLPLLRLATTVVVAVTLVALVGLSRLSFSDDPQDLYARNDAASQSLNAVKAMFGPDDRGLAVVIEGEDLVTYDALRRQLGFVEALREHPQIAEVRSLFDARRAVTLGRRTVPMPLVPYEPRPSDDYTALSRDLLSHPLLSDRMLSDDGKTTVVVCQIAESVVTPAVAAEVIDQVRSLAAKKFRDSELCARVTGPAALRIDTFYRLKQDLAVFCTLGGVAIIAIAWLVFRRLQPVVIALVCPAIGVVWTLGMMGWIGQRLDGLNCLLPTLLFAIGFTDAMYLISAITRRRRTATTIRVAAREGLKEVLPACVLTSITTVIGFFAITLTTIGSLQRFGLCAAVGVVSVFASVLLIAPLLTTVPWLSRIEVPRRRTKASRWAIRAGAAVVAHPVPISLASLALFAVLAIACRNVPFDMRWSEALNASGETVSAAHHLDRTFGGSVPAQIVVRWPANADNESILDYVGALHERLEVYHEEVAGTDFRLGRPFSLLTILEGWSDHEGSAASRLQQIRRRLPGLFVQLVNPEERSLLVTIPLPDIGARRLIPVFGAIDEQLRQLGVEHEGFASYLTGTTVVSARNLTEVLYELVRGLSVAALLAFIVLWIGFRSLRLALLSILPNSMPLLVALSVLLLTGQPMQVTVALTLCLSLGLAADDTIHFITAFRTSCAQGRSARSACLRVYRSIGGAMVMTTIVLVVAFATTTVSSSPAIRLFGCLTCVTLFAALLGDLLILPSLLTLREAGPAKLPHRSFAWGRNRGTPQLLPIR